MTFGRNTSKRRKTTPTTVVLRGPKPEMKHMSSVITGTGTAVDIAVNNIAQGTKHNERIGGQTKAHYINGVLRCSAPVRMDVYVPFDVSDIAAHGQDQVFDLQKGFLLKTIWFNPSTTAGNSGLIFDIKLPYGLKQQYAGAAATDIKKGKIMARFTSNASVTVNGHFQVFYTDI